ncbi:MAG: flagellar basal body L-ring protein FlgH [Terriglobales bacterium]
MRTSPINGAVRMAAVALLLSNVLLTGSVLSKVKITHDPQKTRADYVSRMQQQITAAPAEVTLGSLWTSTGALTNLQADYKASRLNDVVTIVVVQRTTAQATGNVGTQRDFNTSSGISGLAGYIKPTSALSNLLTAQSSTKLKGAGSTDASTTMNTNLAGQVIAVLPNGNLVVEAERLVTINNQKETMLVRGVLRPGDIRPDNSAFSTVLSNLEVELKGKGVVSDATRPPNPLVRALLWVIGF